MWKRVVLIIATVILLIALLARLAPKADGAINVYPKKIALIDISGEIIDTTHILELINEYTDMPNVKAIILRVNSPGGGVAASQEVYRQINKAKEKGKSVVVSMGDMGASGAYYLSAAADKIYANPGTLTGSIGVILNFMNAEKLLGKVGVDFTTIKSGKYKDTGSFSRPATEQEKALLNRMIQDVLNQFVDDVINSRADRLGDAFGIKEKNAVKKKALIKKYMLENVADGRIFTGREAKTLGLIDELGNIDDAIEGAAKMIGVKGRPMVISERKKTGLAAWLDSKISGLKLNESSSMVMQYKMQ